ncbi:GRIP and coiled-coil domain-containing protein 2-like protein [Dinothrombium tinctorium]|uniref:GRIP and coiled-coil domain-containing protein 2-like protein n=1 Tax=Dinothrombium tinctorium TaxID=1965070 RepID=A0A443QMM5_9ACAR|nr:GRIP and coiled-coil domain-containing protein 2-like protein [Dinothrombium tinctorium]
MEESDESGVVVCKEVNAKSNFQHDLEKLQQSHDMLMHQLNERNTLLEKMHSEVDKLIENNDELKAKLDEKERDLAAADAIVKQKEDRINELLENELKLNKVKAFAVKLKKELAEAQEELKKERSVEKDSKEALKQFAKERDKLSSLYQQSVKNFQNLQSEYDSLHDEFDNLKRELKLKETDLTNAIKSGTKAKEDLEECRNEIENLKASIDKLKNTADDELRLRQEIESKVIILQSELDEERKKVCNQTGLEQTLEQLKNELDLKTTEVAELGEELDKLMTKEAEREELKVEVTNLKAKISDLKARNEELEGKCNDLSQKVESLSASYEQEKVANIEYIEENTNLKQKIVSSEEQANRKIKSLEAVIKELKAQISLSEQELQRKEDEFNAYKIRVCKVLSEKKENPFESRVKELEEIIDNLRLELNSSRNQFKSQQSLKGNLEEEIKILKKENKSLSDELTKLSEIAHENENLKSLSRDLQFKLVAEKNQFEKRIVEMEQKHAEEIENLTNSLERLRDECESLRSENNRLATSEITSASSTVMCGNKENHSYDNTDIESVETISLPPRTRASIASSFEHSVNPLEEILFPKKSEDSIERDLQQMAYLTTLYEESEKNNNLLQEQNKALKEEIRRLERNLQRVEIAQNFEYLKNVLMKFLSLEGCTSERLQLVPVLRTILKLNSDEEKMLRNLNGFMQSQSRDNGTNWSNYIWNGFN